MEWFLAHSTGSILCVKQDVDGITTEKVCSTFSEATEFYTS